MLAATALGWLGALLITAPVSAVVFFAARLGGASTDALLGGGLNGTIALALGVYLPLALAACFTLATSWRAVAARVLARSTTLSAAAGTVLAVLTIEIVEAPLPNIPYLLSTIAQITIALAIRTIALQRRTAR